jgi:hypothetical protein
MHKTQTVQKMSRYLVGIISLVVTFSIGHVALNSGYTAFAQAQDGQPLRSTLPVLSGEALQPFKGEWHFDSSLLTVGDNGHAVFIARAYQFCGPGISQPCDAWQGNTIIPGIRKRIVLTEIDGTTAYGVIIASTDNETLQHVTLTLQLNDTLDFNGMLLCGPNGPVGHCGV